VKETIAEMLKVEAQAKKIVADAQAEAAEIVRTARAQAAAVQTEAERNAQARAAKLVRDGVEHARKRRDAMLAEIDRRIEGLRNVAPDAAEAARRLVLAALTGEEEVDGGR